MNNEIKDLMNEITKTHEAACENINLDDYKECPKCGTKNEESRCFCFFCQSYCR